MPFGVRFDDVTSCEVDVVVNSLGTKGSVYGRLCENIINTANDPSLKAYIDKQVKPVGTILVTGAGELKCNNIIHVVTPFKHQDDENNSLLVEAYSKCLEEAIKRKCKSIALPFIGTGANGYSEKDAYKAIMKACTPILDKEDDIKKDIINIVVVGYLKSRNKKRNRRETRNRYEEEMEICGASYLHFPNIIREECIAGAPIQKKPQKDYSFEMLEFAQTMSEMDPNELLPIFNKLSKFKFGYDFVDCYLTYKDMSDKILIKAGMDHKRKNQIKQIETLKKLDVYRLAFICKMNKTETLQFMNCIGISFSPCSNLDRFYRDYINGKFKKEIIEDLYDLDILASSYKLSDKEVFSFGEK